jgi:hypothetical protein
MSAVVYGCPTKRSPPRGFLCGTERPINDFRFLEPRAAEYLEPMNRNRQKLSRMPNSITFDERLTPISRAVAATSSGPKWLSSARSPAASRYLFTQFAIALRGDMRELPAGAPRHVSKPTLSKAARPCRRSCRASSDVAARLDGLFGWQAGLDLASDAMAAYEALQLAVVGHKLSPCRISGAPLRIAANWGRYRLTAIKRDPGSPCS